MYFKENDVIELKDKAYFVEKVTMYNDTVYYEVSLYNKERDEVLEEKTILRAIYEDKLYIIEEENKDIINNLNF